jgi:hypothetical protein
MKNFSTAALIVALTSAFVWTPASAQTKAVPAIGNARCAFLPNAPDQHVVVRGDTLWDISGKFLQHPWCWPRVWDMNREDIRNPHWIYPGQIVYFDRAAGRLRLGNPAGAGGAPTTRLSPHVRVERLGGDAIPTISSAAIEPFLSQPLIIEKDELDSVPRIMATQEGRVFLGKGDKAYVRGDVKDATSFQAFRPGRALKDPITKAIIGYEAEYLGTLNLQRTAPSEIEPHTFVVVSSKEEMGVGDRLLPVIPAPILNYVPHTPDNLIAANIVSVYGGLSQAGQNQVVSVNRGRKDGIDIGTVLELHRLGRVVPDRTDNRKPVKLPDERYGDLFIFRVFNNISYGLVMQVTDSVQVGDIAKSPE